MVMRPIVIAECCQNHLGNRKLLQEMIYSAAENGADYVKIQSLRSADLTFRQEFEDTPGAVLVRPYEAERDRLAKLDLSREDESWFAAECKRAGVQSMITVFTRASVRDIGTFGFDAVKIASYDCGSLPLLHDIRDYWNKIFVSTGATYDDEICHAAKVLSGTDYHFLHCVSIYPTPMEQMHLSRMEFLRQYTPNVGFSDHSLVSRDGIWASKIALALGASVIERHFTLLAESDTKDGPVSISPELLGKLRAFADLDEHQRLDQVRSEYPEWEKTLGDRHRNMSEVEILNRSYYRGRVASTFEGRTVYNWEEFDAAALDTNPLDGAPE